ncbi:sugar transferase [Ruminococcaceae bacterium OttesenSCG-928-D13]|nr:sugar transferase [Ruminococcaceae bacterium OttesenSCG-928-D13]
MYRSVIKPVLDRLLSFMALIVLSPVLLLLALLIKCDSRGPVLFKQKRVGRNKRFFTILKFRTMRADTPKDVPTHLLENPEAQITRMGRFLRRTSLDELPQILNILAGQMSIIGPRPALWNQDDLVAERDKYGANALVPGLTGYAQINGRDELPIAVKAELDGYYTKHISFGLDIKIFFGTILSVFKGSGVVEGRHSESAASIDNKVHKDE